MERVNRLSLAYTVLGVALCPIYLLCLIVVLFLRCLIHVHLSVNQDGYAGLLNIFDLFFDREQPETRSNVTALSMVKLTHLSSVEDVRKEAIRIAKILLSNKNCVKLRSVIQECYGFRYWQAVDINLEKQIRMFDNPTNMQDLKAFISQVVNSPIHDERMWEMYIGRHPIDNQYPIVIKGHHSVADGIGMRDIFVDSQPEQLKKSRNGKKPFAKKIREFKSMTVDVFNLFMMTLCAPLLCISQYMAPKDRNSLRTERLSLKKQVSWERADFQKVKDIKNKLGYTFSEVIMMAVSKSLEDVFESRREHVSNVTIVFPHRRSRESRGLENEFVLAPIQLPIHTTQRQKDVAAACRRLNGVPSYKLNYFAPRFAFSLFPMPLPRWIHDATEFTALVSNFPGVEKKLIFDGYECESSFAVLPNIANNNGLGITLVSYSGLYTVVCNIDEIVCKNHDDADRIVHGIAKYIEDTHKQLFP